MKKPYLSVILPVYNEEGRISQNLSKIYYYFSKQKYSWEMLIIDDGSRDKTPRIVKEFEKEHKNVRSFKLPRNLGKGGAIRKGVGKAWGEIVFFTDVDLSTPIEEIEKLLPWISRGFDIAMGSRRMQSSKIYRSPGSLRVLLGRIFYRMVNLLFLPGIHDTNCGFKAYRTDLARKIFAKQTVTRWGFDAEILYIAQKHGALIKEIPVPWTHYEGSKVKVTQAVASTLSEVFRIKINDWGGKYGKTQDRPSLIFSLTKIALWSLVRLFFFIFFSLAGRPQNTLVMKKAASLYEGDGFTELFTQIRLWDSPIAKVEELVTQKGIILDLGCGDGFLSNYLALSQEKREVIGIEINRSRLKDANKGLFNTRFLHGDVLTANLPKADVILLVHVLHHLASFEDQEVLLSKCSRKLAKGGKLIIVEISKTPILKYLFTFFTDAFIVPILFEGRFFTKEFFYRDTEEWSSLLAKRGFRCKVFNAQAGKPFTSVILECQKK